MKNYYLILSFLCIISCASEDTPNDPTSSKIIELPWQTGQNNYEAMVDEELREFIVHIPESYDSSEAVPVVFMLHGSSGTGQKFYNISRWVEKSEEEGFLAVFPTALEYWIVEKSTFSTKWSSAGLEKDLEEDAVIKDDKIFFEFMLDALEDNFNIDTKRIYGCGFSNGGGFVRSRLLLEMPDRFAAFASSGGWGFSEIYSVNDNVYRPIFTMCGTRDDRIIDNQEVIAEIPISGSEFMADSLYGLFTRNMLTTLGLSDSYSEESNPPQYNVLTFRESLISESNEFSLMLINDMGHNFANGTNNPHEVVAVDHVWPWFMRFSL